MIETCRQRGGLTKIAAQLHHQHPAVHGSNLFQHLVRAVARSIVNEDKFKAVTHLFHDLFQAVIEGSGVLFLIVKRDDDGILRHTKIIDAADFQRI